MNFHDLEQAFNKLPKHEQLAISKDFVSVTSMLDRPAVWAVGSLVFSQPLGDDSFKDFRRWIVFQGREATMRAIDQPDGLVDILNFKASDDRMFVEAVGWLEEPASEIASRLRISTSTWTTPNLDGIKPLIPRTYSSFPSSFNTTPPAPIETNHLSIEGLGTLKVGDHLRHLGMFGVGVIRAVRLPEVGIVDIEFPSGMRTMGILSSFFEKVDDQN